VSLLLQALQKAARSRETGPEEPVAASPQPVQEPSFEFDPEAPAEEDTGGEELTLADDADLFEPEPEPLQESIRAAAARPGIGGGRAAAFAPGGASSVHAATILRASEERSAGWIDWVRERPVHSFAALAGIFLLFYGVYVYLQIFHPGILRGDFLNQAPLKGKSPPPAPSPISKAPAIPLPEATPAPATAGAGMPAASSDPGQSAPTSPEPQPSKPIAGLPQGKPAAPTEPARPAVAAAGSRVEAPVERSRPAPARARREPAPEREFVRTEPTGPLEDTVAVRQPDLPPATGAILMQAWEALRRGQFDQAQALYQRVEETDPQNVDVQLGLAAIAMQRGGTELAIEHYSRALELEPRNPTAQAGLISLLGQADPQLSESRLKQLIAREPSANLYFALGNLYAQAAQWAQAQQAYFQAYQLQPDNPDYAYNLAVGLEHLSQPKLALTYYRQAVELGIQRGHASFDSARVQERIGQLTARVGSE
jgi:Flp pilus assembly protein TadD